MAQLLLKFSLCATLNAAVDIMGFIVAAFLVDIPAIGQGSDCNRIIVCCLWLFWDQVLSSQSGLVVLVYLGSSFFGQVGPN